MNTEIELYKQNLINKFNNTYNNNLRNLNNTLKLNIQTIQRSRINNKKKQNIINNLLIQFNNSIKILQMNLNNDIINIRNFIPKQIKINNKKALLIGINYIGTNNELYGCINDVYLVNDRISNAGFNNIDILTDNTNKIPTKQNILNSLKNLLINSVEGDLLFFLYSGHGNYVKDLNGDELTGYDQIIVPYDLNPITDDELKEIIQSNLKQNVTLFAMFDSCYSGSVLDLKYRYLDTLNYDNYIENNKNLETNGSVFMISGCSDYQTSYDSIFNNKPNGAMTWSLIECLKQNSNITWRELLKNMRSLLKSNGYPQIPQLSCGKFEDIDIKVFI